MSLIREDLLEMKKQKVFEIKFGSYDVLNWELAKRRIAVFCRKHKYHSPIFTNKVAELDISLLKRGYVFHYLLGIATDKSDKREKDLYRINNGLFDNISINKFHIDFSTTVEAFFDCPNSDDDELYDYLEDYCDDYDHLKNLVELYGKKRNK